MVLNISDDQFKDILNDEQFYLPIRWDGLNFSKSLKDLLDEYMDKLTVYSSSNNTSPIKVNMNIIRDVCKYLTTAVNKYLNGFPQRAYYEFRNAMDLLEENPLKIDAEDVIASNFNKQIKLFRVVSVDDNKPYSSDRVFHTPFTLRSKVSTSRYSIAGHPSLYLSTSLELCCEEIHYNPYKQFALAARFESERPMNAIRVIELGIKPQDFLKKDKEKGKESDEENRKNKVIEHHNRYIKEELLEDNKIKSSYLLWYPLVAACSFIRTNKDDPFAAEYILPQLLMQWVRIKMKSKCKRDQLVGIRYFSCASKKASDMGFNYVFPSSKQNGRFQKYCDMLSKAFRVTKPVYLHDYEDVLSCERDLIKSNNIDFI